MSLIFPEFDIESEEINPGSNSTKTLFSIISKSSTTFDVISKNSESSEPREEICQTNYFLEINAKSSFDINYENKPILENSFSKESKADSNLEFKITTAYLNSLYPKCNLDPFLISQYLGKNLYSSNKKKINKEIENYLQLFEKNNKNIKNNLLCLDIINIRTIGYILCLSYSNFKSFNIEDMKKLKKEIDDIHKNKINIYNDYSQFCKERKKEGKDYSINKFLTKKKNKYLLPCELIFLVNYYNRVNILEINYEELSFEPTDLFLYCIIIMNIQTIFPKINYMKINLINFNFQNDLYCRFFRLEKDILKYSNKYIKAFNYSNEKYIFHKKWDFESNFYVQEKDLLSRKDNDNNRKKFELNLINEKIHINELIIKYTELLKSFLITFYTLSQYINVNKFELIINDSYSHEFQFFFKKNFQIDIHSSFHILNFLKNKDTLKSLNIELNAIDYVTTRKFFHLIKKNKSLQELQISFFSSDVSYLQQTIYKIYSQFAKNKKESQVYYIEEPETEMLNQINNYFQLNLSYLFDIILQKKKLSKLGLYFDIPSILLENQKYTIPILKFIINIIFLLDEDNSKLNSLTLLSPNTILHKALFPSIDDYFEDLEIYEKNKSLHTLHLHLKMYEIINIKKIISPNLLILSIGDFDLISFKTIVYYLTSYNFSCNSNLKYLTLGLLKSITDYNDIFILLLKKLYSIKIQHIIELNIYTNIIIDSKEQYEELIDVLKYNWISSSIIILNNSSEKIYSKNKIIKNNINYLVPFFIKDIISNNQKKDGINICYWYLINLFSNKLKGNVDKNNSKYTKYNIYHISNKIIYGIFRYLCCERKMIISHQLKNDLNSNM